MSPSLDCFDCACLDSLLYVGLILTHTVSETMVYTLSNPPPILHIVSLCIIHFVSVCLSVQGYDSSPWYSSTFTVALCVIDTLFAIFTGVLICEQKSVLQKGVVTVDVVSNKPQVTHTEALFLNEL